MKNYSIIPTDWDYNHSDKIREIQTKWGYFTPSAIPEIQSCCGGLKTSDKAKALTYAESMKEVYPYICFALMEGETWGEMEVIQNF